MMITTMMWMVMVMMEKRKKKQKTREMLGKLLVASYAMPGNAGIQS